MSNNHETVIQAEGLGKTYKSGKQAVVALEDLDLTVRRGEIFGYLGPNGAGKTTTIRLLLDLIRPTTGRATILGLDSRKDYREVARRVGYMPGELNLWKNERASDIIRYFARVYGDVDMTYVRDLADRLQFDMTRQARDYSSGNRRKLGIILAMMNQPELLILDEPSSGLDPLMQQTFYQLMREVRDEGRTVFLSSHVLSEVQAICDRVGILKEGQLKAVERVDDLTHVDFRWITLRFREAVSPNGLLEGVPGASDVTVVNDEQVRLRLHGDFDPLLRAIGERYVVDMRVKEPTLEEIFLTFYDGETEEAPVYSDAVKEYA